MLILLLAAVAAAVVPSVAPTALGGPCGRMPCFLQTLVVPCPGKVVSPKEVKLRPNCSSMPMKLVVATVVVGRRIHHFLMAAPRRRSHLR